MSEPKLLPIATNDARQIGKLYAEARGNALNSVQLLIQCGQRLKKQKETMKHGEWLPWLKENEKALGFNRFTAARLLRAVNVSLTTHLKDESQALALSRQIWGNTASTRTHRQSSPKKQFDEHREGYKLTEWLRKKIEAWPEDQRGLAAYYIRELLKDLKLEEEK